jgi:hypothetical protein
MKAFKIVKNIISLVPAAGTDRTLFNYYPMVVKRAFLLLTLGNTAMDA